MLKMCIRDRYVALADEVGYERVDRFVVDVCRSADLLYPAFARCV